MSLRYLKGLGIFCPTPSIRDVFVGLVPGGVAQQDQRLIPGDRLLAVNDINLENASLDQAVQALKGAPKGIVRIVVAKPLPLPDTSTVSPTQSFEVCKFFLVFYHYFTKLTILYMFRVNS